MRRIRLQGLDVETSCLGFGCASLGSRVTEAEAERALARAFDAGVTWYDVAPPYGGGRAESLLARFIAGKRDSVQICTKVGLRAPHKSLARRVLEPIARPLVAALPGLRKRLRGSRTSYNERIELTPAVIEASIQASLATLRTDHVEVLALHAPRPEDVARDDIREALARVIERGQARAISVAGSVEAALIAAQLGYPYSVVQLADDPRDPALPRLHAARAGRPLGVITHSVFGVGGALDHLQSRLAAEPAQMSRLNGSGYAGTPQSVAADLLLDRALAANPDGIVLASMLKPSHVEMNVSRAARPISTAALELTSTLLAPGAA